MHQCVTYSINARTLLASLKSAHQHEGQTQSWGTHDRHHAPGHATGLRLLVRLVSRTQIIHLVRQLIGRHATQTRQL